MISLLLATILAANKADVTCVVWGSTACTSCPAMYDSIANLAKQGWLVGYLDVEDEPSISPSWEIKAYPTVVIAQGEEEIARQEGVMNGDQLALFLRKHGVARRSETVLPLIFNNPLPPSPCTNCLDGKCKVPVPDKPEPKPELTWGGSDCL